MKATALTLLIALAAVQLNAQKLKQDTLDISRSIDLDSVVVTGRMPQVRQDGPVTKIMVENTFLEKLGTANDMLAHTPGLHKSNSGIEVNGMGKPVYVLDGRLLTNTDELGTLQANNIKSIEIDRMPSAEYSAGTQPVVKITTRKHLRDYIYMDVSNFMMKNRMFSELPALNIRGKLGKVSMALSYSWSSFGSKNKETYYRNIYHDEGTFNIYQQRVTPFTGKTHSVSYSLDYNMSENARLSLNYMYDHSDRTNKINGEDHTGYGEELSDKDINSRDVSLSNLHNISGQYLYSKNKTKVNITQDVAFKSGHSNGHTRESSDTYTSDYRSNGRSSYVTSASAATVSFRLPGDISTTAGGKFNYVSSDADSRSDASFIMDGKYTNTVKLTERNPQAFITMSKTLGKFTLIPSVTYSYTQRRITSLTGSSDPVRLSQHYSSVLPKVTLWYRPNDDLTFALMYLRYETQPQFSDMNSGLTFQDSLKYTNGNPDIRAERVNYYYLSASWKELTLKVRYNHTKDPIVDVETLIDPQSNIVTSSSINLDKKESLDIALGYTHTFNRLTLYAEGSIEKPWGKFNFMGETLRADKVQPYAQLNLSYILNSHIILFADYTHQGRNVELTKKQYPVNNLNLGMTASLLKDRLSIYFGVSDLLGKANYNNVYYRYGNVKHGTYGKNDMRGVLLRVAYTIFNKPINVKATNANDNILNRM